jgi:aconitate hydratase
MKQQDFVKQIDISGRKYHIADIQLIEKKGIAKIQRLPFSIKILVENLLRKLDGRIVTENDLIQIANWKPRYDEPVEIPHHPARVLMQDFTGVPAVVDLAAMRDAVEKLGGDAKKINPLIPVELVVDHSVQVDYYGTGDALTRNVEKEYERNGERYKLLKWAQKSFDNFKVVPPNSGICHQVNLEYLGRVVITADIGGKTFAFPDSLVGTDSHTTMINGVGVMGWGVGGIEAEAVMLGQPYYMSIPEVIGVKLTGELKPGVTATDLVLTLTEMLRKQKVVEKFVEYFGPGMKKLPVTDRATIANMSPEYGATMGFFPVDENTLEYLKMTGRTEQAEIVEAYTKAQGLFYTGEESPEYTQVLEFDLSTVEPSLAGPARPQDRIALTNMKKNFREVILGGKHDSGKIHDVNLGGGVKMGDGSVVIAAITSCTNTSNPFVLMGAGLLAKKAVEKGLKVPAYVKTSLVPGSKVVMDYLKDAGLVPYFEALGFHLAGFGCTTCIGNSGPLHPEIERAISENNLNVASVLSGNRNFEARIHQNIKSNFLASPMLVVAFAIAGRVDIDLTADPLGMTPNSEPVFLKDIWPEASEIKELVEHHVRPEFFDAAYNTIFEGDEFWKSLHIDESTTYQWDADSSYIKNPPYFKHFSADLASPSDTENLRILLLLGDSVTTDHISPAGAIPKAYPAGQYLIEKHVAPEDFNSYGSRRGNHEVMMRGTFGNIRIKNQLAAGKEGSFTMKFPENTEMFVYDAAMKYKSEGSPLLVLGGKEYGTGSSRDWAAKGTTLLGIKAVIAESYERIHRSNLVGMGVLPLVFKEGQGWKKLGLDGSETFSITGITDMKPRKALNVKAVKKDGASVTFEVIARLNTDIEVEYFQHGGILPYVLRKILKESV